MICASLALLQIMFAVHRFAQGAADWRSGPRWRIISALCPVHPFPLRGTSPQGETRDMREKNSESYTSGTISAFSPFGGWRHHLPTSQAGALWMLSYGAMTLQENIERPILPPEQGEVRRSRKGGGERSEPISRMVILPYDADRLTRNADFISIAAERQSTTLGPKGPVKLKNPPAVRPVNPKNLSL